MGAMASQITTLIIVYPTVYSGAGQIKHQSSASLAFCREFTGTGEFPAQRASNAENVSIGWSHHDRLGAPNLLVKWVPELTQPIHAKQIVDLIRIFPCVYDHIAPAFISIYTYMEISCRICLLHCIIHMIHHFYIKIYVPYHRIVLDITQMKVIHKYDDIIK